MKWIDRIMKLFNQEIEQEIDLQDMVQHSPEYHKKAKPKFRQTDHGFVEEPIETSEGDKK